MKGNEIKKLFVKADENLPIDELKRKRTYDAMIDELEKKSRPVMHMKNILRYQFYYIDKLIFILYGAFICFAITIFGMLQHTGVSYKEMITACMVVSGILSIISISVIDNMFFGKIGELGKSCYFNTKQCVATWLLLSGMINIAALIFLGIYLNHYWKVQLIQVILSLITPYLISDVLSLGFLSIETREKKPVLFVMTAILVSVSYIVLGAVPGIFLATTFLWWIIAFLVAVFFTLVQIKKLFSKIESGEVLCMN